MDENTSPVLTSAEFVRMPAAFTGSSRLVQILGAVSSNCGKVEGSPAENATRWILDVEQNDPEIELVLKHKYRVKGEVLRSYAIAPLDTRFWGATMHLEERADKIILRCSQSCRYRIAIDTIHSASR